MGSSSGMLQTEYDDQKVTFVQKLNAHLPYQVGNNTLALIIINVFHLKLANMTRAGKNYEINYCYCTRSLCYF